MTVEATMPLSALPYFLRLSVSFSNAIQESIAVYQTDQDQQAFSKILDHFSSDLNYYLSVYRAWQKHPEAGAHKLDLAALERHLNDAERLLISAVDLIRH